MNICLAKRTRSYPLKNRGLMLKVIKKIAEFSGLPSVLPVSETELNVILVNDRQITEINETYLKHQGPTDVISFDYIEDFEIEEHTPEDPYTVGELYISIDTAERQGKEYGKSLNDELLLYSAHGILHLCGYDDHCDEDIKKMRQAEARVLKQLHNDLRAVEVI